VTDPVVTVTGVEVRIGRTLALPPVDLDVGRGEVVALMGPSGSGKTTLLDCLLGLQTPTSGRIRVLGEDLRTMSRRSLSAFRRRNVGIVSQNPELLAELDVVENVAVPLVFGGTPRVEALAAATAALAQVGLAGTDRLRPENLSGGEAQRVALARAVVSPDIRLLVADEPTAALDEENVRLMTDLILALARDRDVAVVVATHDTDVAARCDRVHRLREHRAHAGAR